MTAPRSILVYVGLDLVGDGLMKLPFLRALRAAYPRARITWLAGKGRSVYGGSLAPLVAGLLDEVIEDAGIGSKAVELLRRPLPGRSFDLVIDTQRRLLTTLILKRIRHGRFLSSAAGWALSDARPANRQKARSMVRQLLDLVELASGHPADPSAPLALDPAVLAQAEALLPAGPAYVGLAPGAGGKHKCWPLECYLDLGRRLSDSGRTPVLMLGPAEADWVETVRSGLPQALLPLQQAPGAPPALTIALAARLSAAVANDSGTGHMLAAGGVPLVSLFGPTPPDKFAPVASRLAVLRAQDFGAEAMEAIPVQAVLDAVNLFCPQGESHVQPA